MPGDGASATVRNRAVVPVDIRNKLLRDVFDGEAHTVYVLSDVRWADRKDKVELMLALKEEGYGRFFDLDKQEVLRIEDVLQMDGNYPGNLHLLVDRAKTSADSDDDLRARLIASARSSTPESP